MKTEKITGLWIYKHKHLEGRFTAGLLLKIQIAGSTLGHKTFSATGF